MNERNEGRSSNVQSPLPYEPKIFELEGFPAHLFAVYNTTDIRGIILDENNTEYIRKLARDMKYHYNSVESESGFCSVGEYYAVFDDIWHRTKCIDCDFNNQSATVLFIDRGDEDVFPMENLEPLHSKFCSLPAQSIILSLDGLEIFKDCLEIQNLMDNLLVEKDVYVKVVDLKLENDKLPVLSVELFVEENEKEINVNAVLLEDLLTSILDPKVFVGSDKVAQKVSISHVDENVVFIQIKSQGLKYLESLISNLSENYLNNENYVHQQVLEFDPSKVYIVQNAKDNKWYRVTIIKSENKDEVEVMYIDVGSTTVIKKRNLILLEDLSKLLVKYPKQAIEVKLHKISPLLFNDNMVVHLHQLAQCSNIFYMKVVDNIEEIPVVQLSMRAENNCITNVNDELVTHMYMEKSLPEFLLTSPSLPEEGSYFDVHVTTAAHPDDITVQPLCTLNKFKNLMINLLDVCESFSGPHLTSNCIKVGNVYAAQDEDDTWYRAYMCKIINKKLYLVYACDYGDYNIVPLENLQPLQEEFYELPYQAIKARLCGVCSEVMDNWTVDDSLKLNELIVSKNFVSCIESQEIDNTLPTKIKFSLELVDTNTDEDVLISDIINSSKSPTK